MSEKSFSKVLVLCALNENTYRLNETVRCLVDHFDNAQVDYSFVNLSAQHFRICTFCKECFTEVDKPCNWDQVFNEIAKQMANAEIIIFAIPSNGWGLPGMVQVFWDKINAFYSTNQYKNNQNICIDYKKWVIIIDPISYDTVTTEATMEMVLNELASLESNIIGKAYTYDLDGGICRVSGQRENMNELINKVLQEATENG